MNIAFVLLIVDVLIVISLFAFNCIFAFRYENFSGKIKKLFPQLDNPTEEDFMRILRQYSKNKPLEKAYILSQLTHYPMTERCIDYILINYNDNSFYCRKYIIQLCCQDTKFLIKYLDSHIGKKSDVRFVLESLNLSVIDSDTLYRYYPYSDDDQELIISILNMFDKTYHMEQYWYDVNSKEVHCALLNYMMKHPTEEGLPYVQKGLKFDDWEIKYLSLKCLGNYPDQKKTIEKFLTDSNWYMRKCAASLLLKMDKEYTNDTKDKYAQEMLNYEREVLNNDK